MKGLMSELHVAQPEHKLIISKGKCGQVRGLIVTGQTDRQADRYVDTHTDTGRQIQTDRYYYIFV